MVTLSIKRVPATGDPASKLWVIGEAPGEWETMDGMPFTGQAGKLLWDILGRAGLSRNDVYCDNLCQHQPQHNDFAYCVDSIQLHTHVNELKQLIVTHKPNCILALGENVLNILCERKGIVAFSGSVLTLDFCNVKIVPCIHPATVLREYSYLPLFDFDVRRAASEAKTKENHVPIYDYRIDPNSFLDLLERPILSVDIETTKKDKTLLCIGFGHDWTGVVYPFVVRNENYIRTLLASPIPKIFHNGIFDVSVLRHYGYEVNGYDHDTMIQAHVIDPELPRSLAFLVKTYTRMPYYKSSGRAGIPDDEKSWGEGRSKEELYEYNAKDVIGTYQVHLEQMKEIEAKENLRRLYKYEMELQHCMLEVGMNGIRVDEERRQLLREIVEYRIGDRYGILDNLVGKRLNARSPKDVPDLLYREFALPAKRKKPKRGEVEGKLTTDEDALVKLISTVKTKLDTLKTEKARLEWRVKLASLMLLIELRGLLKLKSSYIDYTADPDGRVRSTWKVPATETGRLSAALWVMGTGMNLQTTPREAIVDPRTENKTAN